MRRLVIFLTLVSCLVVLSGSIFRLPINWSEMFWDLPFQAEDVDWDDGTRTQIDSTGHNLKTLNMLFSLPYLGDTAVHGVCSVYVFHDSSSIAMDSMLISSSGFPNVSFRMDFPQDVDSATVVNISSADGALMWNALYTVGD